MLLLILTNAYTITESKLIQLTAWQASKARDEVFQPGIATLFGKPADQEDGALVSQNSILPKLEFRPLLY